MVTYAYETIPPLNSEENPKQFEYAQHITDAPLEVDPVSGYPVKRVITGGLGFSRNHSEQGCCGGGCHH